MHEIQEYRPGDEKVAIALLVIVVFMVAFFSLGYMLGLRSYRTDVSDNGKRIEDVRNELSTAEERQREITSGLESAVKRSDSIEERSSRIEERAVRSESVVRDAGVLIDECQQIIGRVRNRGQAGKVAH